MLVHLDTLRSWTLQCLGFQKEGRLREQGVLVSWCLQKWQYDLSDLSKPQHLFRKAALPLMATLTDTAFILGLFCRDTLYFTLTSTLSHGCVALPPPPP